MSDLRMDLLDMIDDAHEEHDGKTPDHVILPQSMEGEIRLETLATDREFSVSSNEKRGLIGMQVWFSPVLDEREKRALLLSDDVFASLFPKTKDFYSGDPYHYL